MRAAAACIHAGYSGPAIDVGAALTLAEAFGAERDAAGDLLAGIVIGFNRAMRKRDG